MPYPALTPMFSVSFPGAMYTSENDVAIVACQTRASHSNTLHKTTPALNLEPTHSFGSISHSECMGERCFSKCGPKSTAGDPHLATPAGDRSGGFGALVRSGEAPYFAVIAGHNYSAGQEVFTSYGAFCNEHYLWSYGFRWLHDPTSPKPSITCGDMASAGCIIHLSICNIHNPPQCVECACNVARV